VLRRIGGGAYGEVWLARGVTGALRAVKVVFREDFEDERSFEREFEGILKYEPISRDHPGLVNVLHVGRAPDGQAFYYYVMELGDDILSGREINPIEYEARTLRSDIKRAGGKRLDTHFCIEVGLRLAEALKHLHDHGLAHRDVKPANVIFVGGKAQLADIGLVAARGQRTFVGTEGFVPPEGPGSAQADVYSLGKVLYEMATGRDRLDFPEGPDELPAGQERKRWLELNQVICEICEPQVSRRTIRNAGELAIALAKLRAGKRRRRRTPVGALIGASLLGGLVAWAGWDVFRDSPWSGASTAPPTPVAQRVPAFIKVTSTPDGADVIDLSGEAGPGELIDRTPTDVLPAYVGEEISLRIERDGYQPFEVSTVVPPSAAEEPLLISAVLKVFAPPSLNEPWVDHLGTRYRPLGEDHESVRWLEMPAWWRYVEAASPPRESWEMLEVELDGRRRRVVVTGEERAQRFCDWLVDSGIEEGYLTEDHEALAVFPDEFRDKRLGKRARDEGWRPFQVRVRLIPYGRVIVRTRPPGAEIYLDGISQGASEGPMLIDLVRPGTHEIIASLEGFKTETRQIRLDPFEDETVDIRMQPNMSVVMDRPWENSLGMRFVPAGEGWMASVWETRRSDYRVFAEDLDREMPAGPEPFPGRDEDPALQPVVGVSRGDAEDFCEWLTERERDEDRLTPSLEYRLPSDAEWSYLAGQNEPADASPAKRDRLKPRVFFWGADWPPEARVGNLADNSSGLPLSRQIAEYEDGFPVLAPVGSFPSNARGLHDLCGNAQEWVRDAYSSSALSDGSGVLRGGGWRTYQAESLYIGARNPQPPDAAEPTFGFRVVLAKRPVETLNDEEPDAEGEAETASTAE